MNLNCQSRYQRWLVSALLFGTLTVGALSAQGQEPPATPPASTSPTSTAPYPKPLEVSETNVVTLTGKLISKVFTHDGDEKVYHAYVLVLDKPVDVGGSEFGSPERKVTMMQLAPLSGVPVARYQNRHVTLTGTLFHSHTAHHFTKVLVDVRAVKPIRGASGKPKKTTLRRQSG